ncbi:MAG TPA: Rieske 2Fe-2S domain-containing protein [Chitinophagaceae bacterium]|jgi:3-phenylpropionate/trans-cinnamate dioxygenase ferredoxin subunit
MNAFGKHRWYKIVETEAELSFENDIATATVNDKKICLGRFGDRLFAFAQKCPHAGALMAEGGYIDAVGNVVCPSHRYKFNPINGHNVSGEGYHLKHWPAERREDGIYVEMDGGLFGWLK